MISEQILATLSSPQSDLYQKLHIELTSGAELATIAMTIKGLDGESAYQTLLNQFQAAPVRALKQKAGLSCSIYQVVQSDLSIVLVSYRQRGDVYRLIECLGELPNGQMSFGISFSSDCCRDPFELILTSYFELQRHLLKQVNKPSANSSMGGDVLVSSLLDALESNQIEVFYQPINDLRSGEVLYLEALARWHHESLGPIPPCDFVSAAEAAGVIEELDLYILKRAIGEISTLNRTTELNVGLSVNCSVSSLHRINAPFVHGAIQALSKSSFPSCPVLLEVTESGARNLVTLSSIHTLSAAGFEIAIDDFGAGYTAFSDMLHWPIKVIKLDRKLILSIDKDQRSRSVLKHLIELANALSLKVVAEGVETQQQLEVLEQLGCHYAQGFLLAKPMPLSTLLNRQSASIAQGSCLHPSQN